MKDMSKTVTVGGLRMNHSTPVQEGWACQTCHPDAGHATGTAVTGYTMDMCVGCHSVNPKAVSSCQTCHVGNSSQMAQAANGTTPWQVTHGPQWRTTHGMGDLATCTGCHGSTFCVQCHGPNVPHAANYLSAHGADVMSRADGRKACLTCHRAGACDGCHGTPMPHPAAFLQEHSKLVKKTGRDACLRCHQKQSCDECHARHTHPGLDQATIKALREHPVNVK